MTTARVSKEQLLMMVEFMEQHPALAHAASPLSGGYTAARRRELWQQLAALLNAAGPAEKTALQWRHTWQVWCTRCKKQEAQFLAAGSCSATSFVCKHAGGQRGVQATVAVTSGGDLRRRSNSGEGRGCAVLQFAPRAPSFWRNESRAKSKTKTKQEWNHSFHPNHIATAAVCCQARTILDVADIGVKGI
ncbi:hypothetical protein V5799_014019 [Amblyomma americanum]|uniref:Regulatory protein zeste n=1 Tax=Amblyomma americanum TaxID=6943 RepID=A0AAQ4E480_AMBAM